MLVVPLVSVLRKGNVALAVLAAEAHHLGRVGIHRRKDHRGRMGGVKEGRHAALITALAVADAVDVVIILCRAVGKLAESALLVGLAAEHGTGVVVAGLADHVGKPRLLDQLHDLLTFLNGRCHGNGGIHVFSRLQRANGNVTVQMTLGKVGDAIDVLARKRFLKRGQDLHVKHLGICLGLFRDKVANVDLLYVRVVLKQIHKLLSECAATDDGNRQFFLHFFVSFLGARAENAPIFCLPLLL